MSLTRGSPIPTGSNNRHSLEKTFKSHVEINQIDVYSKIRCTTAIQNTHLIYLTILHKSVLSLACGNRYRVHLTTLHDSTKQSRGETMKKLVSEMALHGTILRKSTHLETVTFTQWIRQPSTTQRNNREARQQNRSETKQSMSETSETALRSTALRNPTHLEAIDGVDADVESLLEGGELLLQEALLTLVRSDDADLQLRQLLLEPLEDQPHDVRLHRVGELIVGASLLL